jgi:hypothetical protein
MKGLPENCAHKQFFWCKKPSECVGCYYHPEKKVALTKRHPDDPNKTTKDNWFYGSKRQAKLGLKNLEDIKNGKGLFKNGTRCRFRHSRDTEEK